MKVLLLNGSPKANGNTAVALHEMVDIFNKEGIETEVIHVGNKDIRGCVACGQCSKLGHCVFNDLVNEVATKFAEADGLVVGSPVYYASANATLVALLTRLFYSTPFDKTMKVGAAVVPGRPSSLQTDEGRPRRCGCPPRRPFRHVRRTQQILYDLRHARRVQSVLEQHSRPRTRRGERGFGGSTNHAHLGEKYDFFDEEHCAR